MLELDNKTFVSYSNAIMRFLANNSKSHFNLYGTNNEEKALVDEWLEWVQNELEPSLLTWLYITLGHLEGDKNLYNTAQNDTKKHLQKLDKQFESNTFLAGKFFTLADFSLGSLLFLLFSLAMTKEDLSRLPNLTRWFTTLALQSETVSVWGNFKWCTKKLEVELKDAPKVEKKAEKKDNKKAEKPEGKSKDEKEAEKERKEKEREEQLAKEEAEHKKKIRDWVEMPGHFDFETFKRLYSNSEKGKFDEAVKYLWDNYKVDDVSFW